MKGKVWSQEDQVSIPAQTENTWKSGLLPTVSSSSLQQLGMETQITASASVWIKESIPNKMSSLIFHLKGQGTHLGPFS